MTDSQAGSTPMAQSADAVRPLDVSIIIEWENVKLSGGTRAHRMLEELRRQMAEVAAAQNLSVEAIVVYAQADFTSAQIQEMIDEAFPLPRVGYHVRALEIAEGSYYEKKNRGIEAAAGNICVLCDSDVIPEPGWLTAILKPFARPEIHAVAGETYVELTGLYSRSMAIFWMFPLRTNDTEVAPCTLIYGNNAAYRRDVFLRHKYPRVDQFRGPAGLLRERMQAAGILTWAQPAARCRHPPPSGFAHFFRRAACQGYDNVMGYSRTDGHSPWRQSYWTLRTRMMRDLGEVRRQYRLVGLSIWGLSGAIGIAVAYNLCTVIGEILTRMNPEIVKRHFSI